MTTRYIHGPLHPDLFAGEDTPILLAVPDAPAVYRVVVSHTHVLEANDPHATLHLTTVDVLARNEEEARQKGIETFQSRRDPIRYWVDSAVATPMDIPPDEQDLLDWVPTSTPGDDGDI